MILLYYTALFVFFFKQKTAYEMRISDWSSDVCSSDLFANIRAYALSNEQGDFLRQRDLVLVGLGEQDRDARLEIGWFDRDRQPPSETRLQALINAVDVLRITIRCQYDLLATINQRIEGVEELLLRALLVGKEVNIVDQQGVDGAVQILELVHASMPDGRGEMIHPLFGADIDHARALAAA